MLQNSTITFIFNLRQVDHISPFRDAVKLSPMETVYRLLTCCMFYKVLKFRAPQYLSKKLLYWEDISQQSTYQDGGLHFSKVVARFVSDVEPREQYHCENFPAADEIRQLSNNSLLILSVVENQEQYHCENFPAADEIRQLSNNSLLILSVVENQEQYHCENFPAADEIRQLSNNSLLILSVLENQEQYHCENFPAADEIRQLSNNSLLILSVVENQEQYHCVATVDSVGSIVSRTATVTLAHLPPLERQPQDLRLFPGQTALFSCLVEGNPPPLVTWIKDGRPLVLDETRMIILPSGSLEIESVQVSDRGNYRCNVSGHGQHRLSDRAVLQVDQDLESAASLMAPTFIAKPRSTVATEGSTVTLECAANGTPNPWLVWLKDGVPIDLADLDTNCILLGTGSLQMRDVEEDDAGNYQCRAENREDSVDATATLQVHVAPRFLKRPRNKIAKEKEDVELECSVYARPDAKVSWLKNGDHIKQNEYLQVVNGNNLRILGLMAQDTGIFQCVASNPAGNIQAAAHLTVVSSALEGEVEVPQQETAPRDVEAAIVGARFVTMRWRPPPQPQGNISSYSVFYREEGSFRERIVNTSRSRLEEVNIQGLQPDRTYVVRVGAYMNHSLGATSMPVLVRTKAEVHVPGPPRHVTARPLSPTAIRVNWQPPAPDTITTPVHGYSLYYLEAEASEEFHRNTTELGYTLENLNKFQEYNVWVVAHNENGAGMASEEITVRTFSDVPSKAPENITLEAASSSMVYVRWEPPPKDGQNGVITGYKVRYRKKDLRGRGDTHTTAGNQRAFLIQNLEKKSSRPPNKAVGWICAAATYGTGEAEEGRKSVALRHKLATLCAHCCLVQASRRRCSFHTPPCHYVLTMSLV
ncbi:putative aminophospholipid-translocase [Homalodisca vitripennis]|nr:putative aminophospholipid-translocase [Homalodisca vitripennis]